MLADTMTRPGGCTGRAIAFSHESIAGVGDAFMITESSLFMTVQTVPEPIEFAALVSRSLNEGASVRLFVDHAANKGNGTIIASYQIRYDLGIGMGDSLIEALTNAREDYHRVTKPDNS